MKDFKNEMEDNLPYSHTNSTLDFANGIYREIYADSDNQKAANHLSTKQNSLAAKSSVDKLIR